MCFQQQAQSPRVAPPKQLSQPLGPGVRVWGPLDTAMSRRGKDSPTACSCAGLGEHFAEPGPCSEVAWRQMLGQKEAWLWPGHMELVLKGERSPRQRVQRALPGMGSTRGHAWEDESILQSPGHPEGPAVLPGAVPGWVAVSPASAPSL